MEPQKIKGQKDCPVCGGSNSAGAVKCQCGASLAGVILTVQPPIASGKKSRKRDRRVDVVKNAPILLTATQHAAQTKVIQKPINPKDKLISDDDVEIVSDEHLDNVQQSADDLGL